MIQLLPEEYVGLSDDEIERRILAVKDRLGAELCILGHYYEREEVVRFADHQGDSFELARAGAKTDAVWIVFCGVHFMAQASFVLASPGQRVFLPDMEAGCPLADMAAIEQVEDAWAALEAAGVAADMVPVTYMNSSAALKAFCGRRGGFVCTSSSAKRIFERVFGEGRRLFFFPDENLGLNTLSSLSGGKELRSVTWDPYSPGGGAVESCLRSADAILWKGHCHVHTLFSTDHVQAARARYPGCSVVVHPECRPEVVSLADGSGSTSFIKDFAESAPAGSIVVIGTEINMVSRLAKAMPERVIVPLARSLCPNMFRISPAKLLWTLENLGEVNEVFVPDDTARDARTALERMLSI